MDLTVVDPPFISRSPLASAVQCRLRQAECTAAVWDDCLSREVLLDPCKEVVVTSTPPTRGRERLDCESRVRGAAAGRGRFAMGRSGAVRRRKSLGIAVIALAACRGAGPAAPRATVRFRLDAPSCSSIIPVQLSIDSVQVGVDTFVVDIAGREHVTSRDFATSAGPHVLGARTGLYTWPERRVTLEAGQAFTDTLPFYCS